MSDKQNFGTQGSITLDSGSGSYEGDFYALQCIGDVTFTSLSDDVAIDDGVDPATLTYGSGTIIYGKFKEVEVASGAVRCYVSPALSRP